MGEAALRKRVWLLIFCWARGLFPLWSFRVPVLILTEKQAISTLSELW